MGEQIDKGNRYTYVGITDRQGKLIYLRWTNRDKGNQYTYDGRIGRQGQSIYLRTTKRETRAINIPTMDEQTDNFKGVFYSNVGILIALACLPPSYVY
jgi:hypothetical protein